MPDMSATMAAAIAVSLYQYNVPPIERAWKLFDTFEERGQPHGELEDHVEWVDDKHWATRMPFPTAVLYLRHALERYGEEALQRVHAERQGNARWFGDVCSE